MAKDFILAGVVFLGTIIGAGIFALPYAAAKSGFLALFFYCFLVGGTVIVLHLAYGEVVLRTKEKRRLPGYAQKYLGKTAQIIVGTAAILGVIGALLCYLILSGQFLSILFGPGLSAAGWTILFWALSSFLVFWGIKSIAQVELWLNIGLFFVIFLIFSRSLSHFTLPPLTALNTSYLFFPFGLVFFSLIGWSAVPEIEVILKNKSQLKTVIIFSLLIAVLICFLFGFILSGVSGSQTTTEPFEGLLPFLGPRIIFLGALFGLLSVTTSFLVLSNYLKNIFFLDYALPKNLSFVFASLLPLALFLLGVRDFIKVLGLAGAFLGLVEGIAILLLYQKAKIKGEQFPAYSLNLPLVLVYFIMAVLGLGALSQIIYLAL